MLIIAEIILTVTAWRKGWRRWALLPMGIVLGIAFVIGVAIGTSGASAEDVFGVAFILDIPAIVALIIMTAKAPTRNERTASGVLQTEKSI